MATKGIDLGIDGLSEFTEIGSGGFATVYAAKDDGFGRLVAVKVLHRLTDEIGRHRFDRERELMGSLDDHPNVVTPYRFGYTDAGWPYLVMEHLTGGSLSDLLMRDGPLPWGRAVDYLLPVADALGRAHSRGMLHRDVKPANILLTADGVPKLSDFGIAGVREVTASERAFTIAQSPPETFVGGADRRDERSDLYSLGATLFNLVTGRPPFAVAGDDSEAAHIRRIEHDPVPSTGDPVHDAFFASVLAKNPEARPPTAARFVDALRATTATETPAAPVAVIEPQSPTGPLRAGPPVAWEEPRNGRGLPNPRRVPWQLILGTGAVLALAVTAATQLSATDTADDTRPDTTISAPPADPSQPASTATPRSTPSTPAAERQDITASSITSLVTATPDTPEPSTPQPTADASTTSTSTTTSTTSPAEPINAQTLVDQGIALHQAGQFDDAVMAYTEAISIDPTAEEPFIQRGLSYRALKRFDEAIADYDQVLALDPDSVDGLVNRGIALRAATRYDEALVDFDRAIALKPNSSPAFHNRGLTFYRLGRSSEAIADYDRAVTLNPTYVSAYWNRANATGRSGLLDRALSDLQTFVGLASVNDSRLDDARAWIAELENGGNPFD